MSATWSSSERPPSAAELPLPGRKSVLAPLRRCPSGALRRRHQEATPQIGAKRRRGVRGGPPPRSSDPAPASWREQRELEAIEVELPRLEAEKAELEARMSSGTLPYTELQAASERIQALLDEISRREERWLELSE